MCAITSIISTKPWWKSEENRNVLTYEEEYNDQYPTTSIDLLEQAFLVLDENFFEAFSIFLEEVEMKRLLSAEVGWNEETSSLFERSFSLNGLFWI